MIFDNNQPNLKFIASFCCILLIVFTFSLNIYRSIDLVMDVKPSMWSINSIPYAMSRILFNQEKYISNKVVTDTFMHGRNTVSNNAGIDGVLQLEKAKLGEEFTLWDNEDKGIIDFVSASFQVLGFKAERIIYFYYLILAASSVIYVIANIRSPSRLIILLQFLIMLYLVQPMVSFNPQLTSLAAPRAFPVLAIISSLHCLFFALKPQKNLWPFLLLAIQVGIIIFVTHLRIVTYWQLLAIISVCIAVAIKNLFYKKDRFLSSLPLIFLIIGLAGLQWYRHEAFPKVYQTKGQPITRVVWHNILSGLVFSPDLANRYQLKIDDRSIIDLVGQYLSDNNRYNEWVNLGVFDGGGRNSGYPAMRWANYEIIAKEVLFEKCRLFPLQCLSANLYYKPLSLVKNLGWAYGLRQWPADLDLWVSTFETIGDAVKVQAIETTKKLDADKQRAYLWSLIPMLLLIIPFIILLFFPYDLVTISGLLVFAICSCIPSIVAYPGIHTIIDTIIVFGVLAYTIVGIILYQIFKSITKLNVS